MKEMLMQLANDLNIDLDMLSINIRTNNMDIPFSFFYAENDTYLIVLATDENGAEKFKMIKKDTIELIEVNYADDLEPFFIEDSIHDKEVMYD